MPPTVPSPKIVRFRKISPPPVRRDAIPHIVGRWQVEGRLGSGRWAHVYTARPHGGNYQTCDYAIKMLRPEHQREPLAMAMLRREVEVCATVKQPHLIPILASRTSSDSAYLVMPRLRGVDLQAVLRHTKRIVIPQALWIARQVGEALAALHTQGWLHGDVTPENVVVTATGHATLLDLGMAVHFRQRELAIAPALMGTLCYCAPERFLSRCVVSAASDVYSFGILLYQLLTGRLPFDARAPERVAEAHLSQVPPNARSFLPELPREIDRFISQLLAKDPLRRPTSPDELVPRLRKLEIDHLGLHIPSVC